MVTNPDVLYHPSSGWVSIAFGQDPFHSDDDVTLYAAHPSTIYGILALMHHFFLSPSNLPQSIQFASIHPICLHLSNLLQSKLTTHGPQHWPNMWPLSVQREDVK